jgi:hypothetical protein
MVPPHPPGTKKGLSFDSPVWHETSTRAECELVLGLSALFDHPGFFNARGDSLRESRMVRRPRQWHSRVTPVPRRPVLLGGMPGFFDLKGQQGCLFLRPSLATGVAGRLAAVLEV